MEKDENDEITMIYNIKTLKKSLKILNADL